MSLYVSPQHHWDDAAQALMQLLEQQHILGVTVLKAATKTHVQGTKFAESMLNVTKPCRIAGTGMHVPSMVDSHTLEAQHGLPEGWSLKHSGVRTRHWINGQTVAELGSQAAQRGL